MGRHEYSVEIRDEADGRFIKQVDVVPTAKEANKLKREIKSKVSADEKVEIWRIDYDKDETQTGYCLYE